MFSSGLDQNGEDDEGIKARAGLFSSAIRPNHPDPIPCKCLKLWSIITFRFNIFIATPFQLSTKKLWKAIAL
jgi:hypothetical protein